MSGELAVVILCGCTCWLNFTLELDALIQCIPKWLKLCWSQQVLFRRSAAHFLRSPALRSYLFSLDSVWNPPKRYTAILLKYSAVHRRLSLSHFFLWRVMKSSNSRDRISDSRDSFILCLFVCCVLFVHNNLIRRLSADHFVREFKTPPLRQLTTNWKVHH